MNPQECVWEIRYRIVMKIILQEKENSLQHYILVHKFIFMPQALKIPVAKAAVNKEWAKLEKFSAWNLTKVKSKKQVIDEPRTSGATVHSLFLFLSLFFFSFSLFVFLSITVPGLMSTIREL